ncbi:Eukaryotic translation initiation factor 2C [Chytridiales sp. JEL 0842]|nr:Eukaryotic translation initiation factor 2C [Chytridiales sp. JEL 0842]
MEKLIALLLGQGPVSLVALKYHQQRSFWRKAQQDKDEDDVDDVKNPAAHGNPKAEDTTRLKVSLSNLEERLKKWKKEVIAEAQSTGSEHLKKVKDPVIESWTAISKTIKDLPPTESILKQEELLKLLETLKQKGDKSISYIQQSSSTQLANLLSRPDIRNLLRNLSPPSSALSAVKEPQDLVTITRQDVIQLLKFNYTKLSAPLQALASKSLSEALVEAIDKILKDSALQRILIGISDTERHPELKREVARVRVGVGVGAAEEVWVTKRKGDAASAVGDVIGERVEVDDAPVIGIAASGGGCRAMIHTLSTLSTLQTHNLLQSSTYLAGVSGSTWAMALLYDPLLQQTKKPALLHARHALSRNLMNPFDFLDTLKGASGERVLSGLVHRLLFASGGFLTVDSGSVTKAFGKHLMSLKGLGGVDLSDIFGALLTLRLMVPSDGLSNASYDLKNLTPKLSMQDMSNLPLPIYTAVTRSGSRPTLEDQERYQWLEFTPFEVGFVSAYQTSQGCWIPTWSFGRHFEDGQSVSVNPEVGLGLMLGIFGSAFTANFARIIDEIKTSLTPETLNALRGIVEKGIKLYEGEKRLAVNEDVKAKVVKLVEDLLSEHPITPSQFPNMSFKLNGFQDPISEMGMIPLMDSGMDNGIPFVPLLRPERKVDILIIIDGSADIGRHPYLHLAEQFARRRSMHLPLPHGVKEPCVLISRENMEAAEYRGPGVVVYLPCAKESSHKSNSSVVTGSGDDDFDPATAKFMKTHNFYWTPEQVDQLHRLSLRNVESITSELTEALRQVAVYAPSSSSSIIMDYLDVGQREKEQRRQGKKRLLLQDALHLEADEEEVEEAAAEVEEEAAAEEEAVEEVVAGLQVLVLRGPPVRDEVLEKFVLDTKLVSTDRVRPHRPSPGTIGKKLRLFVNMYPMTIPTADCYHYDITISSVTPKKTDLPPKVNRDVMNAWKKTVTNNEVKISVFDGRKNLFTPKKLPAELQNNPIKVLLAEEEEPNAPPREFTIAIKHAATINMERLAQFVNGQGGGEVPRDALQVFDILLKSNPTALFHSVNRSTGGAFFTNTNPKFISGGLVALSGWKQSIRPTYKDILLNIDVATTCYYMPGPLLEVVCAFFNTRDIREVIQKGMLNPGPSNIGFQRFSKFLATVSIVADYRGMGKRKYKIKNLSRFNAETAKVEMKEEKKTINVKQYFKTYKNMDLQFPQLPLIACGTGQVLLPMEVCSVRPGQRHIGKLSDAQVADVIKIAAVPPPERQKSIMDGRQKLQTDSNLLSQWGVSIQPQMKEVEGRVLPDPVLSGAGNSEFRAANGVFDYTKVKANFFKAVPVICWSVAVFADERRLPYDAVCRFMSDLFRACAQKGMHVEPKPWEDVVVYRERYSVEDTLQEANMRALRNTPKAQESGKKVAQMVFCIMDPFQNAYDEIKFVSETKMGLITQCFKSIHVLKTKPGMTTNLALKVNAKLGGVNTIVDPKKNLNVLGQPIPTMIMGADVTHPPPAAANSGGVSIAAVVASMDAKFAEYRSAIRVQGPRVEILQDLGDMTTELMNQFRDRSKIYPKRIIFYRDGVSEGQFGEVSLQEIQRLKQTLRDLGCSDTKLTFLVVNKRHATRFFAKDARDADRKGNLPPGVVVDTGVVHPFEFDFYLNSHPGLQGTSKPAHYHVLYDENGFNSNDLQQITYNSCYLYARASRAVSIVPPAYYAHLVAARARCYRIPGMHGSESGGSGGIDSASVNDFAPVLESIKRTMYFT